MEIYFSRYNLTPLKQANHLTDLKSKTGVFLKTGNASSEISDYFPHSEFGDQPIEKFLESFPDVSNPYHQSILRQLNQKAERLPSVSFLNHQLWHKGSEVVAPVVKYKFLNKEDFIPEEILRSRCRIRLDANGALERKDIYKLLSKMDLNQIKRIEYIEDPGPLAHSSELPIPTAKDFIEREDYHFLVYKPNRSYQHQLTHPTIFSSYMGSQLGILHAYRELIHRGDLTKHHGLLTPGMYKEEVSLFTGNFSEGFTPDLKAIDLYLTQIKDQDWSYLCSI